MGRDDNKRREEGRSMEEEVGERAKVDPDRLHRTKLEEALEIKSLRRIISAYINYPDAAEQDVRRYESSFRKLPPSHKALLSHLPLKYQQLRRCIRANTYFIISMLQAFEPPLDMSQDMCDVDENLNHDAEKDQQFEGASKCNERNSYCSEKPSNFRYESSLEAQMSTCSSLSCEENSGRLQDWLQDRQLVAFGCDEAMHHAGCGDTIAINDTQDGGKPVANGTIGCHPCDWWDPSLQLNVPLGDVDKVRCIIRNIVRDWAIEGQKERDQCYKPILEELVRLFPSRCKERPPACLVPGAGLGRLALEISCLGFVSQGNEFSYYMMICSNFILNHTQMIGEWTIHPWIHSNCNSFSDCDQLRALSFPDILPASAGITDGFSMCGGDFVEVYSDESQKASWDAVVTCFFLDTAHNIIEYIEVISKILKDGGVWINIGPLLYHFADTCNTEDEMSIELSLEDVKRIVRHYSFQIEVEKIVETTYTTNPKSMMQNRYFAAFWSMKKIVQD